MMEDCMTLPRRPGHLDQQESGARNRLTGGYNDDQGDCLNGRVALWNIRRARTSGLRKQPKITLRKAVKNDKMYDWKKNELDDE